MSGESGESGGVDRVRAAVWVSCLLAAACTRVVGPGADSDTRAAASGTGDESDAQTGESSGVESDESGTETDSGESSESETTETDTGETTETDTGDELPEACACIIDEPGGVDEPPEPPLCGELLCPAMTVYTQLFGNVYQLDDPAALACAITALRDRTPGQLAWTEIVASDDLNISHHYVLITEDGAAIRRSWNDGDTHLVVGDAELGGLEPPATYDACLQEPDLTLRYQCLRAPLASVDAVCDEGWIYPEP